MNKNFFIVFSSIFIIHNNWINLRFNFKIYNELRVK